MFRWEGVFRHVWSGSGWGQLAAASPLGGPTFCLNRRYSPLQQVAYTHTLTFSARHRPLVHSRLFAGLLVCVFLGAHICHWFSPCPAAAESSRWMLPSLWLSWNFTLNAIWIRNTFWKSSSICLQGFLRSFSSLFLLEIKLPKKCLFRMLLECTILVSAPLSLVSFPSEFIYTFYRSVYFDIFLFTGMQESVFPKSFVFFFGIWCLGKMPWELLWMSWIWKENRKLEKPFARSHQEENSNRFFIEKRLHWYWYNC